MRLSWIRVRGYRRFSTAQTLPMPGKLTALVGPNEAGKTSLLEAVAQIDNDEPLDNLDRTRGRTPSPKVIIEAAFLLEDTDREELKDLAGGESVRWLKITKSANGARSIVPEPTLRRDLMKRTRTLSILRRAAKHRSLKRSKEGGGLSQAVSGLVALLSKKEESLPQETLEEVRRVAEQAEEINVESAPQYIHLLPKTLRHLVEEESKSSPQDIAIRRLKSRIPDVILFDDANRRLGSTYDLSTVRGSPPAALRNLVDMAGLNLNELWSAIQREDQAEVNTLQTRANSLLARKFREHWSQSGVQVEFRTDGTTLHIQIRDEEDQFSGLDERSDGLRQFVALLAFCTQEHIENPVLLIDEAESHLHYDAQADLLDMLARQDISKKIVYSTHSMGCLPEDLGTGVRLIMPDKKNLAHSVIVKKFWSEDDTGFSALLFGMGATTLAFLPLRTALLVEGPSDHILLPAVFREVAERDFLGFQVVPGLSTVNRNQIPELRGHGSKVLYLVDNDQGGEDLSRWLKRKNVPKDQIFKLARANSTLKSLEDVICPDLFVRAANQYRNKWDSRGRILEIEDLKTSHRFQGYKKWCDKVGNRTPSKVDFSYEVLDCLAAQPGSSLIADDRRSMMKNLLRRIESKFNELEQAG